jgi:hypothetical protein
MNTDEINPDLAAVKQFIKAQQGVALALADAQAARAEAARTHRVFLADVPVLLAGIGPGDAGTARALITLIGAPDEYSHQQEIRDALAQVRDHCARVGIDLGWTPKC